MHSFEIVLCCILFVLIIAVLCGSFFVKTRNNVSKKEFNLILEDSINQYNQVTGTPAGTESVPNKIPSECWTYVQSVVDSRCSDKQSSKSNQCILAETNTKLVKEFQNMQKEDKYLENDNLFLSLKIPSSCSAASLVKSFAKEDSLSRKNILGVKITPASTSSDDSPLETSLTDKEKVEVLTFFTKYDPEKVSLPSKLGMMYPDGLPDIPLITSVLEGIRADDFENAYVNMVNGQPSSDMHYSTPVPPMAWNSWVGAKGGFHVLPPHTSPGQKANLPSEKPYKPWNLPCKMLSRFC